MPDHRETYLPLEFPSKGIDVSSQEPPPGFTEQGVNVRWFESVSERGRGGSRPGLSRFINDQLPGVIQDLNVVVGVSGDALLGNTEFTDGSGRGWPLPGGWNWTGDGFGDGGGPGSGGGQPSTPSPVGNTVNRSSLGGVELGGSAIMTTAAARTAGELPDTLTATITGNCACMNQAILLSRVANVTYEDCLWIGCAPVNSACSGCAAIFNTVFVEVHSPTGEAGLVSDIDLGVTLIESTTTCNLAALGVGCAGGSGIAADSSTDAPLSIVYNRPTLNSPCGDTFTVTITE